MTYTGTSQTVAVSGVPSGTVVKYSVNGAAAVDAVSVTDAGTYTVVASFTMPAGYAPVADMTAMLTISKAAMPTLTFEGDSVEYDTFEHSLGVVGNVPTGATVKYYYNNAECDSVTEVGEYTVRVVITHKNYVTFEATATLKITSKEEQLFSVGVGNVIYFQNNLDENKLYKYQNGLLSKVNNDEATFMMTDGTSLFYVGKGLLSSNIKNLDASGLSVVLKANAEYLTTDGENLYYAINGIFAGAEERGIWRIALDGSNATPVRISTDKAKYLVYYDGAIYYANQSNGKTLCKVSVNANNATGTVLWDEKVEYIIADGGALYFDSTDGLVGGSAIRKYNVSNGTCIKLTTDSGKYLTKIGSYIYYVNNDLLTSSLFGKTISRVSAVQTSDSSLPGTQVISDANNGFSSLATDGELLYFYRLNDKHFYCYDVSEGEETDLMAGFTPPIPTVNAAETHYVKIVEYDGAVYYIDPLNGDALYKYDLTTRRKTKVLDDAVSGAWFHDGKLYYSAYVLTNYAFYVMDLDEGTTAKLTSQRADHVFFTEDFIYYVKVGSAYNNYIVKIAYDHDIETDEPTVVMDDTSLWVADLAVVGDDVYFVNNKLIGGKKLHKLSLATGEVTELGITALTFTVSGDTIYYFDNDSKLKSCSLTGGNVETLVTNVEINDLVVKGNKIYFSSTDGKVGLYTYDLTTEATTQLDSAPAEGMVFVGDIMYFFKTACSYLNDYPHISGGDYHLYSYNGLVFIELN